MRSTASRCADLGAPHAGQKQHLGERIGGDARVPAGQKIFQHAHLREQFAMLERARKPEPRDVVRRAAGDVLASEADCAAAAIDAADAIEHAGLAGAVRPDQREQFAGLDRERHVVEHGQPAKRAGSDAPPPAQPYHLRDRRYCLTSR